MSSTRRLPLRLVIAALGMTASVAVHANWTASGTGLYRDRVWDETGFTGAEPTLPIRFADVEVRDASSGGVLARGKTDASGRFSIAVSDSSTRSVQVRILTRSTQSADLFLEVTDANFNAYAVVSPTIGGHNPDTSVNFGDLVAGIGAGGEAFNLYDMGVLGIDYVAHLNGARPPGSIPLTIVWAIARGQTASTANATRIDQRDTSGYDDAVLLHELGHWAVFNFSRSDNPGGTHALADCAQDMALAWEEGHASHFGGSVRRHFGLPRSNIYLRTDGGPGPGRAALWFDLETESRYECQGATSEVSVATALWDIADGATTPDSTPGADDGPVDVLEAADTELWQVMTTCFTDSRRSYLCAEDFWDCWFASPIANGLYSEMRSIFADGVEIRYHPDPYEPNDTRAAARPITANGVPRALTFFSDPDGDRAGGEVRDEDWFSFPASAGVPYTAETIGLLSAADTFLTIVDSSGSAVVSNDDRSTDDRSSLVQFTPGSSGTYYARVRRAGAADTTDYGSYDLIVRPTVDTDGDATPDVYDNCPTVANPDQSDSDGDAVGDACDPCPGDTGNDDDGDGRCAGVDNCPNVANADQADADGDALGDACDPCRFDAANDADADGVCGDVDNCPLAPNPAQANADGDPLGDDCDPDDDDDGVPDTTDNCRFVANPSQADANGDGYGDACQNDFDGDGIANAVDNCPTARNPSQADADDDGHGDACDACPGDRYNDGDGDGICHDLDNCPTVSNPDQADADADGLGDVCNYVKVLSGAVDIALGATEVTNDQYAAFLNAVAKADPNALWVNNMASKALGGITRSGSSGSYVYTVKADMGAKPVNYVAWLDAARYVNWLHNGKPTGAQGSTTTETGAYDLTVGTPGVNATRQPGARWFLPTRDEWNAAAYSDPSHPSCCAYPTRSNTVPIMATADTAGSIANPGANVANFNRGADWNGQNGNVTTAGSAGRRSASAFGTYDQGGNVVEWTQTYGSASNRRDVRGGAWDSAATALLQTTLVEKIYTTEDDILGFRVAGPSTCADADGDGWGTMFAPACRGGDTAKDCDDTRGSVYPGAPEICDGRNNDCGDPSWPTVPMAEADGDADGVPVCADNCPEVANPSQADLDGDGSGDPCDNDDDADGVDDATDNCPTVSNGDQADGDADGIGNACDPDRDGDGVPNDDDCAADRRSTWQLPGNADGLVFVAGRSTLTWWAADQGHVWDLFRGTVAPGVSFSYTHTCFSAGLTERIGEDTEEPEPGALLYYLVAGRNSCGSGPLGAGTAGGRPDGSGCASSPASDTDGDGVPDVDDACPRVADPAQVDADGDGVGDPCDNCPLVANPGQVDGDRNGIGDACDGGPTSRNVNSSMPRGATSVRFARRPPAGFAACG